MKSLIRLLVADGVPFVPAPESWYASRRSSATPKAVWLAGLLAETIQ